MSDGAAVASEGRDAQELIVKGLTMLVLGLKLGQTIILRNADGQELQRITLIRHNREGNFRLAFDGDPTVEINREELDRAKFPESYQKGG